MKALVNYIDFHWDNHQGGSGKSFELTTIIDLPHELMAGMVREYIETKLHEVVREQRPFSQSNSKATIVKIELC